MKNTIKKIFLLVATVGTLFAAVPTEAAVREYDTNAIIYGGVYSVSELRNKLNNGTGRSHQSSAELTRLFSTYKINTADFGQLKSGTVNKKGEVIVNGKIVARDVFTMGRHYISGSTRDTRFSYPIYVRRPRVSFVSDSIPAFVSINYDGSYAYAVLKPCGNIVRGPGVRAKPEAKYSLEIRKFNDLDGDGSRDSNENLLGGFTFTVTGPNNYSKQVITSASGNITLSNLTRGTYTVTEITRNGWRETTPANQQVLLTKNSVINVGNQRISVTPSIYSITAYKYEDVNGNGQKESNEAYIPGWEITLTGNGQNRVQYTDASGKTVFENLTNGTYTVTESSREGWRNITTATRTVRLNSNNQSIVFGNQQKARDIVIVDRPTPVIRTVHRVVNTVTTIPTSGPAEAAAGAFGLTATSGAIWSWLRSKKALLSALKIIK